MDLLIDNGIFNYLSFSTVEIWGWRATNFFCSYLLMFFPLDSDSLNQTTCCGTNRLGSSALLIYDYIFIDHSLMMKTIGMSFVYATTREVIPPTLHLYLPDLCLNPT